MKPKLIFPVIAIAVSMALAACGTGAGAANASPSPDEQKAMLAFAQCMREHGVDVPDPGAGGQMTFQFNGDPASMEAAQKACQSRLKGQTLRRPSAAEQAKMRDAMVKFSQCMREHGIDMPDPQFDNNGGSMRIGPDSGIDPTSSEFQAAEKACQSLLPFKPGTTVTRSAGSGSGASGSIVTGSGGK